MVVGSLQKLKNPDLDHCPQTSCREPYLGRVLEPMLCVNIKTMKEDQWLRNCGKEAAEFNLLIQLGNI